MTKSVLLRVLFPLLQVAMLWMAPAVLAGGLNAQVVCATCEATGKGEPFSDPCTVTTTTWQQTVSGNCALRPEKCLPNVVCLFSVTVNITDLGCGFIYQSRFCTQLVDQTGSPTSPETCSSPSWVMVNPSVVTDYPVPCGKMDGLKFERVSGTYVEVVAYPQAVCSACDGEGN